MYKIDPRFTPRVDWNLNNLQILKTFFFSKRFLIENTFCGTTPGHGSVSNLVITIVARESRSRQHTARYHLGNISTLQLVVLGKKYYCTCEKNVWLPASNIVQWCNQGQLVINVSQQIVLFFFQIIWCSVWRPHGTGNSMSFVDQINNNNSNSTNGAGRWAIIIWNQVQLAYTDMPGSSAWLMMAG